MRINFVAAGAVVSLLCLLGEHTTAESQISQISQLKTVGELIIKFARGPSRFGRALGPSLEPALKSSDACFLILYGELIQTEPTARIDLREMFRAAGVLDDQAGLLVDPAYVQRQLSQIPMSAGQRLILIETLSKEQQQFITGLWQGGVLIGESRPLPPSLVLPSRPLRSLRNPPQQLGDEVELLEMYQRMSKEHRGPGCTVELCVKSNGELSVAVSCHKLTMSFATRGKVTLSATSPDGAKTATVSSSLYP